MLKIFNTMSHQKEIFQPIHIGKIGMYVCGITVYDLCHIGHGRTFVAFDVIVRYLRYLGYDVTYVRNITDMDDKILKRAAENNETCQQLTERMILEMYSDFDALNILRPDDEPKATDHITEIIALIKKLIARKYAYIAADGDVVFAVKSAQNYGLLSRQNLEYLKAGARIEIDNCKEDPMDFVLWKRTFPGDSNKWDSPWGVGRPGWHIACSAMNIKKLGQHFDIHGGGSDLLFPHHENEIVQSTCSHGYPYVNYWVHTGMVVLEKKKMSKSLNNFFTIRDLLFYFHPETIRYFLISTHYRSQLYYSEENLWQSHIALERLYIALRGTDYTSKCTTKKGKNFEKRFCDAMDDDFNTPEACAVLFEIAREVNRLKTEDKLVANSLAATLRSMAKILGLLTQKPEDFLQDVSNSEIAKIKSLVEQRNTARQQKNWILADNTRNQLNEMKIILEDGVQGTTWRRKYVLRNFIK